MLRSATTAIAAVLAMSSTALLAQDATPPDTSVDTPVTAPDPLAPASTPEPIVAPEAAPVTTATPEAEPAAKATTTRTTKATNARRTTATARPASRPAPATAVAVTPAPAVAGTEPLSAAPVAEIAPIVPPAEPVAVEPAASRQAQSGVFMAIAAAGLVLAALIATLVALRSRRRRREALLDEQVYETEVVAEPAPAMTIEPEPVMTIEPALEPAFVAAPGVAAVTTVAATAVEPKLEPEVMAAAVAELEPEAVAEAVAEAHEPSPEIDGPVTEIPEGFDLSRFGPHTQAAYQGPTEDNPSLSLKHRLRKAAGMDQMAKREAEAELVAEAESAPVKAAAARAAVKPGGNDFMLPNNGTKATVRRATTPVE